MRTCEYARDYNLHVSLVRDLLDLASLPTDPRILARTDNALSEFRWTIIAQCQCPTLPGTYSFVDLTSQTVQCDRAVALYQKTRQPDREWLQLPCKSMPLVQDTLNDIDVNPRVVTALVGFQSYLNNKVLIPHPVKKEAFWGVGPPAISNAVPQYKRLTEDQGYEQLKNIESVESGKMPLLARRHQFDPVTGRHLSAFTGRLAEDTQSWITAQGTTSKAASPAGPSTFAAQSSGSVSGLTQQFEQLLCEKEFERFSRCGTHP